MKRRKWMALMLCAGIFMADFSGIPLKVSAEQVEQAETTLDDQGTQKDDGENTELIQETEDENNSEESPIETEPEESAAEDTTTEELPSTEVVTELKTTIVSNKTAREYVDRTVELTTNVEDAVGNVEYQYTEEYRGETAVVQEYAENPVYSFKTSSVGEHVYRVNVKDENGNIGSAEYKIEVVAHPSKVLSGKLTSNKTQKEYVDRKITLTAEATNGYGNYQYRFTEKKDGVETALQDYGDTNTYSFITKECGEHTYYVYIKDAEGQEIQLSYTMTVVLHPQKKLTAELSSNKTNREYIQRTVVLTAAAKGGYGKIKYQFSETYGSTTAVRQAYSEKNTYTFKTSGTGHHVFYVDMIDEQGQKSRASYEMNIVAHPDNVLTGSVTSNKTTKEYIDRNICLTANAKGGYGSLKYQFVESYNGKVTVVHCTYDPITKNGTGFTGRKVKGTIHWVPVHHCKKVTARLYENLVDEEKGVYNEDGSLNLNPNSLTVIEDCYVEPAIEKYKPGDSFQFVRNGYFCIDTKDSTDDHFVFNRVVSLKSSFKLPKK